MRIVKQNNTTILSIFAVDPADHFTGKTGLTVGNFQIYISKNGGAFSADIEGAGAGNITVAEIGYGWYSLTPNDSATYNTVGDLVFHITYSVASTMDPIDFKIEVATGIVGDIIAKLPTNYIMGSSMANDMDDEITAIYNKLPTHYIVGAATPDDLSIDLSTITNLIGTPVDLGDGADLSSMITAIADNDGGGTFSSVTDSLAQIAATQAVGAPTPVVTDTTTGGTINAGTQDPAAPPILSDNTQTQNNIYWKVGGAGLDLELAFHAPSSGHTPVEIEIWGRLQCNTPSNAKWVDVYAWNYTTSGWDKLSGTSSGTRLQHSTSDVNYLFTINKNHIDPTAPETEMKLRFYTGGAELAANDYLYLDYVTIYTTISNTITAAEIADEVWHFNIEQVKQISSAASLLSSVSGIVHATILTATSTTEFQIDQLPPTETAWNNHTIVVNHASLGQSSCVPILSMDINGNIVTTKACYAIPVAGDLVLIMNEVSNGWNFPQALTQMEEEAEDALIAYGAATATDVTTSEGVITSAISGLNDLSSGDVVTAAGTALATYDPPTKAELDSGLTALNDISAADVWNVDLSSYFVDPKLAGTMLKLEKGIYRSTVTGWNNLTSTVNVLNTLSVPADSMPGTVVLFINKDTGAVSRNVIDSVNSLTMVLRNASSYPTNVGDIVIIEYPKTINKLTDLVIEELESTYDYIWEKDLTSVGGAGSASEAVKVPKTQFVTPSYTVTQGVVPPPILAVFDTQNGAGVSGLTHDSITFYLIKNGGDPVLVTPGDIGVTAAFSGAIPGLYFITLLSTHVDTVGKLLLAAQYTERTKLFEFTVVSLDNNLSSGDVETAVGTALATYDPPTKAELDSGLAGLNDLSSGDITTAVWDAPISEHLSAGSTGKALDDADATADPTAVADAVWNAIKSGHTGELVTISDNIEEIKERTDRIPDSPASATDVHIYSSDLE